MAANNSQHLDENLTLIARYLENYFDGMQNLPDDIQRNYTQMRERDKKYLELLKELAGLWNILGQKDMDALARRKSILQVQRTLIIAQEIGDEKLQLWQTVQDLAENKLRHLDGEFTVLDMGRENEVNSENHKPEAQPERASKRSRRQRNVEIPLRYDASHDRPEKELPPPTTCKKQKKKKRKSKVEKEHVDAPFEPPIDPDEPTYCLCEQVSFGEMICCDNTNCEREWFHFQCVGLVMKPKGKWFCPNCRGDRSNQMKQPSS